MYSKQIHINFSLTQIKHYGEFGKLFQQSLVHTGSMLLNVSLNEFDFSACAAKDTESVFKNTKNVK